ncbi:TPA: VOC family protein [bacterium]|jgi:lactoylglutathione lyase|nr:VOC family protein [bacterium]
MIKGISHLAFNVTNMEKALHFYQDILGFEKAFTIDDDNGNPWIVYLKVKPYQFIELFYSNEKEFNKDKLSYSHLCLEVDDINVIANHLKKNGIKLDVEPIQGKDKNYQCWCQDYDGNKIEFMQLHNESLQVKVSK